MGPMRKDRGKWYFSSQILEAQNISMMTFWCCNILLSYLFTRICYLCKCISIPAGNIIKMFKTGLSYVKLEHFKY